MGLEITPVRGLRQRFGIDGSVSLDLGEILVDEWLMERRQARYRFTLAHEIGHVVLQQRVVVDVDDAGIGNRLVFGILWPDVVAVDDRVHAVLVDQLAKISTADEFSDGAHA